MRRGLAGLTRPALLAIVIALTAHGVNAQAPDRAGADALARRVSERMAALQREAERLAIESRTLVGELRGLEIERDLQVERASAADEAAAAAGTALERASERLAMLEQERIAQLPDLKLRLVDLYKKGRGGYTRLLAGADSVRDLARATRAVASLTRINQLKIDEHRRTLAAVKREQDALAVEARELEGRQADAAAARGAAERAVAARAALIVRIDQRRDLTLQLTGELQVAGERLEQQLSSLAAGRAPEAVTIPLAPFRGALDWPAPGRLRGRFGQAANRLGGSAVRNGIEIEAAEGAAVRAVHGGSVALA